MSVRYLPIVVCAAFAAPAFAQAPKPAPVAKEAKEVKEVKGAAKVEKIDFEKQIWPILEKRCLECHSTAKASPDGRMKKPKGGVVLDGKDGILASKKGKLVVAKKPEDSQIFKSVTLPADDEDRMPTAKKGEPLTQEQTDLIKAWITQGAEFGTWTGKAKEAATDKPATDKPGDAPHGKPPEGGDKPKDKPKDPPKDPPKHC